MKQIQCKERPEWLEKRREFIMATDVPKILGISEWGGPGDVAADKWNLTQDKDEGIAAFWGHALEGGILNAWAKKNSLPIKAYGDYTITVHPSIPFLAVSLDGETELPEVGYAPVEAKSNAAQWIDNELPSDVIAQSQAQVFATEAKVGVVVGFVNRFTEPASHVLPFDPSFWDIALPLLEEFWGHIKAGTMPTDRDWYTKDAVRALWPKAKVDSVIALSDEDLRLVNRLEKLKEFEGWVKDEIESAKVGLAISMAENETGTLPDNTSYTLKTVVVPPSLCLCGRQIRKGNTHRRSHRHFPPHVAYARKALKKQQQKRKLLK